MTQLPDQAWIPPNVDEATPSSARMYDYLLGGHHNFAVDRATVAKIEQIEPDARLSARLNRAFMARVVRHLLAQGVRQFLDIGSGIPTVGNVHEIAHQADPDARVVYVDRDAVAVAHSELLLAGTPTAGVVEADAREVDKIFKSAPVRELLDLDQPVGLLFMMVLHWIPASAEEVAALVRDYTDRLAPGSYLGLNHTLAEQRRLEPVTDILRNARADSLVPRERDEILSLFGDLELVEPGLVSSAVWHPDGPQLTDDTKVANIVHGGVARKR
ncbi:hypothetical protein JOF53_004612 [Crossiella equi]|uniref:S-adenosyl methyltransferase n=1 Tax=Crossiella equi TaxID=130796 RepID=A0ABS5AGN5_9PSEU|nr:SAM-dependent methyltransferase [Crossiella equi]MBP2475740.1 hypothetical protein [Crossiella equi]